MKHFVPILIILILSSTLNAQWVQTPCTGYIYSVSVNGNDIFAGSNTGVNLSQDNGNSWVPKNNGLSFTAVVAMAINGSNIFAASYGVYLSQNNGDSWTADGLIGYLPVSFAGNSNNLFAGTDEAGVYLSQNNGNSWNPVNNGLGSIHVGAISISGNNIFIGTEHGAFLSQNNGGNWTALNNGLPIIPVNAILIAGNNIFAGTYYGGSIYLSTDNGSSWVVKNSGLPSNTDTYSFATFASMIFAGTGNGVVISKNLGDSWTSLTDGMPATTNILSLAINEYYLFAGTENGVWKYPLSALGLSEKKIGDKLLIFPNPASDKITISKINNNSNVVLVSIFNIEGQKLLCSMFNSDFPIELDVKNLAKGIYFINLQMDKIVENRKLVVQ